MSRKAILGIAFSICVLSLAGGFYTNCSPLGEGVGEENLGSGDGGGNTGGGGEVGGGTDPSNLTAGQRYWNNTLLPALQNNCNTCHALPFQGGTATLNIFNYNLMKALAQPGPSASDNPFMNTTKGILDHGAGGNQCPGDVNGSVTPCREIRTWVLQEFPLLTDGMAGVVNSVTLQGRVSGWVADPANFNVPQMAIFHLNDVEVGSVLANGQGIGATNGKYFNFQIPAQFNDGVERELKIYVGTAVADNLIPFMPIDVQSFTQSPLGSNARNIYENELRPRLNQCQGCHQVDYNIHWFNVGNPTPANNGTSTNNELINYMNGQNNHSGGGFCNGNKGNEPCATVQRWWLAEFGT